MKSVDEIEGLARSFGSVQRELLDLLDYVKNTRASLGSSSDELSNASDALASIGEATEKAAHDLLEMVEKLMVQDEEASKHLDTLEGGELNDGQRQAVEGVLAAQDERTMVLTEMMTSLSFQDLTCQTLEKVVKGLGQLEGRILHILDPESAPPVDHGSAEHAGSMSGLSRLEETQHGDSKQDMIDQLLNGG